MKDDESTYYIFYADKTAEYYAGGKIANTRSELTYTGDTQKEERIKINIAATGTELLSFTVKESNGTLTPTVELITGFSTEYTLKKSDESSSDNNENGGSNGGNETPTSSPSPCYFRPYRIRQICGCNQSYSRNINWNNAETGITDGATRLESDFVLAEDSGTGIKITLLANTSKKIGYVQGVNTANSPYYKYNAATNELGTKSVKIERIESVESVKSPNKRIEMKGDSGNTVTAPPLWKSNIILFLQFVM